MGASLMVGPGTPLCKMSARYLDCYTFHLSLKDDTALLGVFAKAHNVEEVYRTDECLLILVISESCVFH
jgi:hypothetical protein